MYARVTTLKGKPEETEKGIKTVSEEIVPKIPQFKGCKGFYYLIDRKSGKSMGITLWDSKQALDDSEHADDDNRSQAAQKAGSEIISIERFEIAVSKLV